MWRQVRGIRLKDHAIQRTAPRDALCPLAAPDHAAHTKDAVGEDLQHFFQKGGRALKCMNVNFVLARQSILQDVQGIVVSIACMNNYRKIEVLGAGCQSCCGGE